MTYHYSLPFAAKDSLNHAKRWGLLAVLALAVSGIAPLLLLAGRASMFAEKDAIKALFKPVLVVHVDLSVLVWFLAIAGMYLAAILTRSKTGIRLPYFDKAAPIVTGIGALLIAASPLQSGDALMSNYIPVVDNALFFIGLALVFCGQCCLLVSLLFSDIPEGFSLHAAFSTSPKHTPHAVSFAIVCSFCITLIAVVAIASTPRHLPDFLEGVDYYELLFWAGGHALQFLYIQLLLVAWLCLASAAGIHTPAPPMVLSLLSTLNLLMTLVTPLPYWMYDVTSFEFVDFYTKVMKHGGGLASVIVAVLISYGLLRKGISNKEHTLFAHTLFLSFLLFAVGGTLGYRIEGSNTIIPAHYHGVIISITLALMGMIYLLLPQFGYAPVHRWKLARLQPFILAAGQLMHIIGFAWAGGYGVMRKTAGSLQQQDAQAEIAMQLMRLGGLIAVIGGAVFIAVVVKSVRRKNSTSHPTA